MIYLEKDNTNQFVLTLTESSRLVNPFYLFHFKNEYEINDEGIFFTTPDTSSYTNRYNQFTLIDSVTGSTSGGTSVPLSLVSGQYEYTVYESTGSTLSISATTGRILEEGRMVVASNENMTITTGSTTSIYN
jgi:hypothetical protein